MFCRCIREFIMNQGGNLKVGSVFPYKQSADSDFPHVVNTKRGIIYSLSRECFTEYFELIVEQLPETD